jgi:hypothetical protein
MLESTMATEARKRPAINTLNMSFLNGGLRESCDAVTSRQRSASRKFRNAAAEWARVRILASPVNPADLRFVGTVRGYGVTWVLRPASVGRPAPRLIRGDLIDLSSWFRVRELRSFGRSDGTSSARALLTTYE